MHDQCPEGDLRDRYFGNPDSYLAKNHFVKIRADIIRDVVLPLRPLRILDVGCGDGGISIPLAGSAQHLVLVDPSSAMLDRAKRSIPKNVIEKIEFREASLQSLQASNRYDLVLAMGLLAHVDSVPEAMARLSILTEPGGHLIIQLTDCDSLIGRFNFYYSRWREGISPIYGYALNRLSTTVLAAAADSQNLRLLRKIRYSLILPGMSRLPNGTLYALARVSRHWPFNVIGGESIVVFEKLPEPQS